MSAFLLRFRGTLTPPPPLLSNCKNKGGAIPTPPQNTAPFPSLAPTDTGTVVVTVSNLNGVVQSSSAQLTVLAAPTNAPDISGLVLHLTFDNTLADATGRGNDGVAVQVTATSSNLSSATFVSGMVGSA